ncbi:MAG TPA: putative leader peptide [Mycobacteriales bacterium]|nr:putative leader peptide [Mycobacteriales bacterium]HVE30730.1 putative leader peptide [Mycobacteriales bacterium]
MSDSEHVVSVLLVSRRHIDLRRVDSAVCQG